MKQQIQGVLFDLDGTLVDTIPDIAAAVNVALADKGLPPLSEGQVMSAVGRGLKNALIGSLEMAGCTLSDEEVQRLYDLLMRYYEAHPSDQSYPYEGIVALLNMLVSKGIAIGVLSNKADSLVQPIVRNLFAGIPFSRVEGMRSDRPRKPDPQGIYAFANSIGAEVSQVLYIGDSEVDWQTAAACPGVQAALVTWGFRSKEQLQQCGATPLLDTVQELEELICR